MKVIGETNAPPGSILHPTESHISPYHGRYFFVMLIIIEVLFAREAEQKLFLYPQLPYQKINWVSVASQNYAVCGGIDGLWEWRGEHWQPFDPPFPVKNPDISVLKTFSPTNTWIICSGPKFYYYSKIYHFDGEQWKPVFSPNFFKLQEATFLDSSRFLACGNWGDLIFFDGKKGRNLPSIICRNFFHLTAFSEDRFYVVAQQLYSNPNQYLFQYTKGLWVQLTQTPEIFNGMRGTTPDTGIILLQDEKFFRVRERKVVPDTTLLHLRGFHPIPSEKSLTYFFKKDTLWRLDYPRMQPITRIEFIPQYISSVPESSYFILHSFNRLYLLTPKFIPSTNKTSKRIHFDFSRFLGSVNGSGHLGVGLYRNTHTGIDIYLTSVENQNNFYTAGEWPTTSDKIKIEVSKIRGLFGISRTQQFATWDNGVYFADLDNDGDSDAILSTLKGNCLLYENTGNDRFLNVSNETAFHLTGRVSQLVLFDLNEDGLIDMITGDELGLPRIFVNKGFLRFREVSDQFPFLQTLRGGLPAWADTDGDGDCDLFFYRLHHPITYLENKGINKDSGLPVFEDRSTGSPDLTTRFDFGTQSMAFQDYDNDGDMDLLLVNRVTPLALFNNDGRGTFTDVTREKRISYSLLAYGANWADFDQNGYPDFFLTTLGRNYIFWNRQGNYFEIDSLGIGGNKVDYSRGSAAADFDGDGDMDIVVANGPFGSSKILSNFLNQPNNIAIWLEGKKSNRMGIGGQVWLYDSGHIGDSDYLRGYRQISTQTGYASSGLPAAYFGISPDKSYDAVIRFPSGESLIRPNLTPGNTYTFSEHSGFAKNVAEQLSTFALSLVYKRNRRELTLRTIFLFILLVFFGSWHHRTGYWRFSQHLFFLGVLFSVYLLTSFILFYVFSWKLWILPVGITLFTGYVLMQFFSYSLVAQNDPDGVFHLFDLLRQFHHNETGMKQIDHLLFFANNLKSPVSGESIREDFGIEASYFLNDTLPVLQEIFLVGWRTKLNGINPGKIRQTLKNFRTILKNFPARKWKLSHATKLAEGVGIVKEELKWIRFKIDERYANDLPEMLNEVLARFPQFSEILIMNPVQAKLRPIVIRRQDFQQVLSNLFNNSLEAMKDQIEKKIQITITEPGDGRVKVVLQDSGPGVPVSIREHIFEETFSTKSSTGLGLFHARKLLRRYGGEIEILPSESGEGAKFQLTFREFQNGKYS